MARFNALVFAGAIAALIGSTYRPSPVEIAIAAVLVVAGASVLRLSARRRRASAG